MASVRTLVGAVDQGTSSSRFLIFCSKTGELITYHQTEIQQILPKEGWVEENPKEILSSVLLCMKKAVENLEALNLSSADIKCIGITNQRETTVVWDKETGEPLYNAIVWLDTRTASTVEKLVAKTPQKDKDYLRPFCGLPITTYFSAVKLRWLIDNVEAVKKATEDGRCLFGTVDSWLMWNLTGGVKGGLHVTDVTNASRTMLMNIHSLKWDQKLCSFFEVPMAVLPQIRSCSEIYGYMAAGPLQDLPISGSVESKQGLLTTVGYKLGKDQPVVYALEGAVAIAGACVKWLKDNLGIIKTSQEIETLATNVDSTHGCYFVPAFSGLFCPYWQMDARGVICGLTQFTTKEHIARAALEAVCFQTREILEAMTKDSGIPLKSLQVDGGMTANQLLMQLQADLMGINVVRPSMPETTALGAAMAAGAAKGVEVWSLDPKDLKTITTDTFTPCIREQERDERFKRWKLAVQRSMHWETQGDIIARSLVRQYFFAGYTYSEIILILFCQHGIYISLRHLHRLLRSEGLRRHAVWDEQVSIAIQRELEGSGSCLGYRSMARRLLTRHGITASREHVADLLRRHDPVGVSMRRTHHFSRRTYTSKGPNFLVHIDGYDKLKRYGFAIHGAVCGFSRRVLWLNVAHTNNNPSVVASYFMKFIKEIKGVPRCIRIDAGTENVLIADIQKAFRWDDDDNMAGEQSVICGSSHSNQRIERWWLSGKQGGCQFWIDLFRDMEMAGLLSTGNPVHIECARVCFMDLLQEELNQIQTEWNQHHVRFSNTSDSPSGKPDLMYYLPVLYSTVDYKVPKRSEDISAINCFCDNRGASEHQQIVNYRAGIGARNKPQTVEEALLLYGELLDHFA